MIGIIKTLLSTVRHVNYTYTPKTIFILFLHFLHDWVNFYFNFSTLLFYNDYYNIQLDYLFRIINKFSIWIRWMVLGLCTISNETYCNKIWYTISDFPYVNARKVRDCIDCMLTFNIRCQHICFVLKSFIFCYRKSSMKIIFKTLSRKKKNCKKN